MSVSSDKSGGELAVVWVPFHDDKIAVIQNDTGERVVVSHICDNLGLDYSGQLQRLKREPWAKSTMGIMPMVAADGKRRDVVTIPRDRLPMWLATIDVSRVGKGKPKPERDELQRKLTLYQNEAADVLAAYFLKKQPLAAYFLKKQPAVGNQEYVTAGEFTATVLKLTSILEGQNKLIGAALALRSAPPSPPPVFFTDIRTQLNRMGLGHVGQDFQDAVRDRAVGRMVSEYGGKPVKFENRVFKFADDQIPVLIQVILETAAGWFGPKSPCLFDRS